MGLPVLVRWRRYIKTGPSVRDPVSLEVKSIYPAAVTLRDTTLCPVATVAVETGVSL